MMKRFLLGFALCAISVPAWAACGVTNLQVKDNAAVTALVPYADDGSGGSNCSPQIQIKQGGNVAVVLSGGAIKVDNSAVTQPVSGTVTANLGTLNGAATAANQATEIASLATIATNTGLAIPAGTANIGNVGQISQYPTGATPITASATGTTAATTATLAGTGGKTTFICGYSIRANATAAATVTDTITGTITGTLSSILWVAPAASGIGVDEMVFSPCIPASATNTGIAIVSGAPGSGGTVSSKGWGYQL